MKEKKKKEAAILAVLLLVLVGAVVFQLTSGKKASPGKAASEQTTTTTTTTTDNPTPAAVKTEKAASLDWVDQRRLVIIAQTIAGQRNPFHSYLDPEQQTESPVKNVTPIKSLGGGLQIPKNHGEIIPSGADTLGGFPTKNVEPYTPVPPKPTPPPFQLTGVMMSGNERYAAIKVSDRYYTLLEGEVVPAWGWIVTDITPSYVVLKKETEQLTLRLSGGSQK